MTKLYKPIGNKTLWPLGAIYISVNATNPSTYFGGTWELVRTTSGGELIAYGMASCTDGGSTLTGNTYYAFSDTNLGPKAYDIFNYVSGILTGTAGAILVKTKGIVGFLEATMYISGRGQDGQTGFWFAGNFNDLPSGVTLVNPCGDTRYPLLTGPQGVNYGGAGLQYFFNVSSNSNLDFYINPKFCPYNGNFKPGAGGTGCWLMVKAYAKPGYYLWKRTA